MSPRFRDDMSRRDRSIEEGDARWVARVGELFRPAPLDDAGRTRFDARLRERIETRGAPRPGWPVAATAAALGALLVLAAWPGGEGDAPPPSAQQVATAPDAEGWEHELFLAVDEARAEDVEEGLPDEYVAIAHAFSTP